MSLNISKILLSQPEPAVKERSPFYDFSSKHKVEVDYRPLIHVECVALKEFRAQRIDVLQHTAVIFTSRTTIDSFFSLCESSRVTVPEGMKYICQTEAVALYLQKYIVYRKRKISFGDGGFKSLVELIVKNRGEKFLLTLTEPHKPELPEALTQLGLNFTEAILAHTVSSDMTGVDIKGYDLVALYSPSDVKALCESFPKEDLPIVAVFGRVTLAAAIEAGLSVKAMAPTAAAPSMVKAVEILDDRLKSGEAVEDVVMEDDLSKDEFLKTQQSKLAKRPRVTRK
ncbi:MAG: uroporphyrinogen-III synthase [Rikenellaceae bacterium]